MNPTMALRTYHNSGTTSEIETASRYRLVQILMERAIEQINLSLALADRQQVVARRQRIIQAVTIIDALRAGLDKQDASHISERLNALYTHMIDRLLVSNATHDRKQIEHVAKLLTTIKSAWDQVPATIRQQPAQSSRLQEYFDVI